jgi:hypothetical protein
VFIDETELDRCYETRDGVIWVAGLVRIHQGTLLIDDLLIYPATGSKLQVGVGPMLDIVRPQRRGNGSGFLRLRGSSSADVPG